VICQAKTVILPRIYGVETITFVAKYIEPSFFEDKCLVLGYLGRMEIITTTQDLESACLDLATADFITIDTEFLREKTFWPVLCLIQLASPDRALIVDPLAKGIDLAPFFKLMADQSVLKVFHAARQDLEIVFHLGDMLPKPIFDSQVAAMVLGFGDSVAYDSLVSRITGAHIDKTSRFTDWSRRPLTDQQLDYALADVTHLRDVYLELASQLETRGRSTWLNEEMAILEARKTYDMHPDDAWRRLRNRMRKPQDLAILQKIAAWRENMARGRNVPRGRVLKDDALYEIAQQKPRDSGALGRLRTIPKGWERSELGNLLMAELNIAYEIPKEEWPEIPRHRPAPEGTGAASDLLKVLLKTIVDEEGVAAKVIANADDLDKIAARGADADVAALSGWRRELFGDKALKLISGELALKFTDKRVQVIES
jgi:ribonuclease D